MVMYCVVNGCKSTQYTRVKNIGKNLPMTTLFSFPKNVVLQSKWIEALTILNNQENASKYAKNGKICALHFASECIEMRGGGQYRLKPNSVPSIFPCNGQDSNHGRTHLQDVTNIEPSMEDDAMKIPSTEDVTFIAPSAEDGTFILPSTEDDPRMQSTTSTSMTLPHFHDVKCEIKLEEVLDSGQSVDECVTGINSDVPQTEERNEHTICVTPRRVIRYPGDISTPQIKDMTPDTLNEYVHVLKKTCSKKTVTIKRLRNENRRQKLKIASLKKLLEELRQKCQVSGNSSDIIQAISEESTIETGPNINIREV